MKKIDLKFFPGWTRKSISFTIDDGNMTWDRKFIDITRPHGIRGTFNLCRDRLPKDAELCREFYRGYEIANHCNSHPFALRDDVEYKYADTPFDKETADTSLLYRVRDDGYTMMYDAYRRAWVGAFSAEDYVKIAKKTTEDLDEIFGKGSVRSFAWPYGPQSSEKTKQGLVDLGIFYGIRGLNVLRENDDFRIPEDKTCWTFTTRHERLLEAAEMFEKAEDNGELKCFIFGVHSADFQTYSKWDDLEEFSVKYGDRPDDYFYATVGEIFDYERAIAEAEVTDEKIVNNSALTLYALVDGERVTVAPHEAYMI